MAFKLDLPAPTNTVAALASWCVAQLQRIAALWNDDVESVTLTVLYVAPERIRPGMLVYADGTQWNPGSGEGVYRRNAANAAWVYLG